MKLTYNILSTAILLEIYILVGQFAIKALTDPENIDPLLIVVVGLSLVAAFPAIALLAFLIEMEVDWGCG